MFTHKIVEINLMLLGFETYSKVELGSFTLFFFLFKT